jgi:DNA-binding transcriptional ArsR family regulator
METYERQAALLKAIGHPVRLRIVNLLRVEPECVCHLSAAFEQASAVHVSAVGDPAQRRRYP